MRADHHTQETTAVETLPRSSLAYIFIRLCREFPLRLSSRDTSNEAWYRAIKRRKPPAKIFLSPLTKFRTAAAAETRTKGNRVCMTFKSPGPLCFITLWLRRRVWFRASQRLPVPTVLSWAREGERRNPGTRCEKVTHFRMPQRVA